jgi:prolyl-tRNA synthetase
MLDVYADMCSDLLAVPVVKGIKSATERFAGADETFTIEALMQNGWALQSGTSHFLGQNFARAFDVTFQDAENNAELVWATSWGVSTRLLGALVMTHSDDLGLVLPPRVAPTQVVVVPISPKGPEKDPEAHAKVMDFVDAAVERMRSDGIRVQVDTRWNMKPGRKFYEWERRGVPIRMECGPRDVDEGSVVFALRTGGEKLKLAVDGSFGEAVTAQLDAMQSALYESARERLASRTYELSSYDEMASQLKGSDGSQAPGFFLVPWHDDAANEEQIKQETKATIRCYPLDQQDRVEGKTCFYSGRPATHMAIFARAF